MDGGYNRRPCRRRTVGAAPENTAAEFSRPKLALDAPFWSPAKRLIDVLGSSILLLLLSPLFAILVVLIASSGHAILFSQTRIGKHGARFRCYKFRTMRPNAEQHLLELLRTDSSLRAEWTLHHKLRIDPRVTTLGAFLRRTSLDELPQLLNVLKGEMSLVGPRPIVQQELNRYGKAASWYLAVRPGMTGLWQVSGRNNTGYRRRIALDCYYVRNQGLLMDIGILLRTILVVTLGLGAY